MARGDQTAQAGEKQALTNSSDLSGKASQVYSSLAPTLAGDVAHAPGYNPSELANMNTAAQQSMGGAVAGATGQGGLLAARTNNAGAAAPAIADAARTGGQGLSKAALAISGENADLKQHQRSDALKGLQGLYGTNVGGATGSLDASASNASWNWAKYILDPALGAAGSAAGGALAGCWIAEAIYGVDDTRTHLVRRWLNGPFRESLAGDLTMRLYLTIGRQVAWVARRSALVRAALRPLFDMALERSF